MNSKIVLITGGSSGIGKSIGNFLTKHGFKVYGTTRDLKKYPNFEGFELLEMDVRNPESVNNAIDELLNKVGRLDVLINNAGVGITGPLEETPNNEIMNAHETNFMGPLNLIKASLPQMRKQKSGLIINITSIAGYMGLPYRGIYSATKGALELITESLRMETKDFGIECTCLAPGDFATNIAAGRYHAPVANDSPYRESYEKTLNTIDEDVDKGGDPEEVAKKVLQIINTKKPKVHYKVGAFMQKVSTTLKSILPDTWFEKLLMNHSKK
ncbi:SDR family oxidoreductase [Maribacter sp. 4G9]|uniref:SDR family oxidoreductase n=1 Tax=Maribacter sp. 4G9 TaxID=1889777 RepID=UPI000C150B52|nr:SDR family oxidoreductase [Maribacter sp. 4G9]PIB39009.1 short-chain dehydrogenase/reductase [Maribacter sp. 4G9]